MESNDGIPLELCGLQSSIWPTYGGIRRGEYCYVKYDRRNGPINVGQLLSLRDSKTFEVGPWIDASTPIFGVSIIATSWPLMDRIIWWLTGKPELGKWSPIRFFFVQKGGYFEDVRKLSEQVESNPERT